MPFNPQVTEVTYDGSLYTGYAELCFHYGKNDTPILIRQKTFKDGWIPVVGDCWKEGNIQYQIEMFAAPLNDSDMSNCINFVKITMSNTGKEKATGYFNISTRGKVDDYRLAELKNFSEDNLYEIQMVKSIRIIKCFLLFLMVLIISRLLREYPIPSHLQENLFILQKKLEALLSTTKKI